MFRLAWWKWVTIVFLVYAVIAGFLVDIPRLQTGNLDHTARNLYFHVPMWFGMVFVLTLSVVHSVLYLRKNQEISNLKAVSFAEVGVLYGMLGLITGMVWGKFTWGDFLPRDVKIYGAAVAMLIYLAYFILRSAIENKEQAARISAVYNIFAYAVYIPLIFVMPRLYDSIHPGNGGNPGFNAYDLNGNMRMVFYPAVIGFLGLALWIATLRTRVRVLEQALQVAENRKQVSIEIVS
ncbi:cytochrome c biogenesis protein CcsA [Raineya orbicola]|jgi:heme exporter protein C|uniref:Heme exporter protein C n=1 Tax=Raineya orbicola TaxID=2016530 RepID=A0A2N3IK92_9BACT|nr:cytochrome c biogenesis protein CcsA [Raineya orbicola]PKQ70633.1 Cytochrome C assembly protein [Raineya orbicola]